MNRANTVPNAVMWLLGVLLEAVAVVFADELAESVRRARSVVQFGCPNS
ncbi:MAG: hypothetical protein HYV60_18905 [Planctomycetia bacterium]|nr:hypothetical protein [Planctomycetia bacterium]